MNPNNLYSLAEEYERSLKIRNLAESTIKEAHRRLEKFFEYLSSRNIRHIEEITKDTIKDYQIELYNRLNRSGRPNGVACQNKMLAGVKQFFKFLKENDHIIVDPTSGIPYAKEPKKLPRSILTSSETKKLVKVPDTKSALGYRDRTILEVLYSTGIRKSELGNLTLLDIDFKDGLL
jgi:integrase/recombinase XerD